MTDLLWPGDHRAGDIMTDAAVLDAMLRLEASWSAALADREIIPPSARVRVEQLRHLLRDNDITAIAVDAEAGGNPVIPLLAVLRPRLDAEAGRWLHRGMTSQDVVDTALMLTAREACDRVTAELAGHVELLATIVDEHRRTPMLARTLTQSAVPITFGAKAARWLDGILDALDAVNAVRFPIQLGGAAGTLSGAVELADANAETVLDAVAATAAELGLDDASPWHTVRAPLCRISDAVVVCASAWGHVANDVLLLGRNEIGELGESAGGGSSTMPHKSNPTLSVLIRRHALVAPGLASVIGIAGADSADERAAGGWHAEWSTLRILLRHCVVAASQTTDLLRGLHVDGAAMSANLQAAGDAVRSEQRAMADLAGHAVTANADGATDILIERTLHRARQSFAHNNRKTT